MPEVDGGANPQKEDGYTPIANEILEALARTYLSPQESKLIWVILRKTYGWKKKDAHITLTQFSNFTGMNKSHISSTLTRLIKRNIVTRTGNPPPYKYGLQKDYTKWKGLPKQVTVTQTGNLGLPKQVKKVTQTGNKKLCKKGIEKGLQDPKETIKEKEYKEKIHSEENSQEKMRKIIEYFKTLKGYSEIKEWDKYNWKRHTKPAKLLLTLTGSVDKAIKVIDWLNELYEEKNLDWTLETVIKKYPDFQLKEIEAQKDKEEVEVIKKVYIKKEEKEKVLNKKAEQIYNRLTKEQKETLRTLAEDDLRRGMKLIKPPLEERENIIFGLMINRIKNKLQRAPP